MVNSMLCIFYNNFLKVTKLFKDAVRTNVTERKQKTAACKVGSPILLADRVTILATSLSPSSYC